MISSILSIHAAAHSGISESLSTAAGDSAAMPLLVINRTPTGQLQTFAVPKVGRNWDEPPESVSPVSGEGRLYIYYIIYYIYIYPIGP